ncbi:mitochondrial nucleotide exchange factor MGE1 [Aspergillus alliaceus]|uniref:mitochondrial nucleotide exchange factor MGE1 n=1 Tax=Petromyces alliaceus TaxID=209559 RepID=UPI0012A6F73E|nr:mitochondrial co-chaperone GrpE [Aspergillus alliaceus]KAB8235556.1 mitochondrial co-chaperone GrpE [Aspergillus alliaceus]
MFQRTILRQAQAVRPHLSVRSASAPLALRRTSQFQPQSLRPLARLPVVRSYSTENKAEKGKQEEKNGESESQNPEDSVRKELEKKEKEVVDLKDKYVRSVADFLNLQERTKRDMDNARNFAIQRFAVDLLESIDNFDRALLAVPEDKLNSTEAEHKDIKDLVSGLKMTQNILMNTLKKHGLERFDPSELAEDGKAQKFDPNLHEATFMAKAEGKENGDIMYTQSKGFRLNGRVLRAAKVGVVKND